MLAAFQQYIDMPTKRPNISGHRRATDDYIHSRAGVYRCRYHIVLVTKYRRRILIGSVGSALHEILKSVAEDQHFRILACEIGDADHVHIFIELAPGHVLTDILKHLKGRTARRLFNRFPVLRQTVNQRHLWSPSYFVATVGVVTEATIRAYIANQHADTEEPEHS